MSVLADFLSLRESPHHLRMLSVFVVSSFIAIFTTTLILGTVLANYMISQMTMREAVVSMQFLNSTVHVEGAGEYFHSTTVSPHGPEIKEFFVHVSQLPDVFRANVYNPSGEILWSSDSKMIGRSFENNDELVTALQGKLHPELGIANRGEKDEHASLPDGVTRFIEYYIPIWSEDDRSVIGAVEVYKAPQDLLNAIGPLTKMAWLGAAIAGCILFSALLLVVGYSTRVLRRQEQRLIETEKLAVVGEMASAVAHGLRNPLAAIRSCAELVSEDPIPDSSRSVVNDIVDQVDRLEGWIRSFLIRNRSEGNATDNQSRIDQVVARSIENFKPQMDKRRIRIKVDAPRGIVIATTSSAELEQLLNSVISNALEAMKTDGLLTISWSVPEENGQASLRITDTGPGISDEAMSQLFVPFQSGKSSGLGIGLALSRRMAERLGGHLKLRNLDNVGVEVTLSLPARG